MKRFGIQTIDHNVSSEWWKIIIKHFVKVGDNIEIRCWKEETDEILQAQRYGKATEDGNEVSTGEAVKRRSFSAAPPYKLRQASRSLLSVALFIPQFYYY